MRLTQDFYSLELRLPVFIHALISWQILAGLRGNSSEVHRSS